MLSLGKKKTEESLLGRYFVSNEEEVSEEKQPAGLHFAHCRIPLLFQSQGSASMAISSLAPGGNKNLLGYY